MAHGRPFLFEWQQAVREHGSLSGTTKLVLMMLSTYSSADGRPCFPSQKRLAKDCSKSVSTVKRSIAQARHHGLVSVTRKRRGRKIQSNVYSLEKPPEKGAQSTAHGRALAGVMDEPWAGVMGEPLRTQERRTQRRTHQERSPRKLGERARKQPSRASQELLALWRQLLGGHPLNPDVLAGATYEQLSTAMAWTLWRHRTSKASRDPLRNLPGYYAAVLGSCRRGEKRLRAYSRQDMWAIATEDITPATFFT